MLAIILFNYTFVLTLLSSSTIVSCFFLSSLVKQYGFSWLLVRPFKKFVKRVYSYRFLFDAQGMIQEAYDLAQNGSFVVNAPDVHYHFVTEPHLIKEVDHAPKDVLSLQAAAKIILQPEYSMHRFDWSLERGTDGTPLVRTLRSLLRNDLPNILPKTRLANSAIIDNLVRQSKNQRLHLKPVVRACVARSNARVFFGEEIATNKEFMEAAEDFISKTMLIAETARLLPRGLSHIAARFLESQFSSQRIVYDTLVPIAQQRIDEQELKRSGHAVPEHKDCMQWIMQQSSRLRPWSAEVTTPWTAGRIVHELMALWFGSVHAMGMTIIFAVRDLCIHPEYVDLLRKEFEGPSYEAWERTGYGLPLLDSFLKESARMNPIDSVSVRRKALKPFDLSNGVHVDSGEWLATPLQAMLQDPKIWADPSSFHGLRHVDAATLEKLENAGSLSCPDPTKAALLTDTRGWQTWGTGRTAW
ncbi:cytochrome P450 [Ophiobolus disseminans]|uniref:Cytochrome P450 n=1 Tax=Ophiobolus disseminans TaxID=1469910 RepID=A0A6A6ZFP6_9PLEO|nr:cytochrome P450 [Ophiobolus disseminans]